MSVHDWRVNIVETTPSKTKPAKSKSAATAIQATHSVIKKPLLAVAVENVDDDIYPCLATPKIDGIRALRLGNDLVSRQFKPIRNATIRKLLTELLPEGSDGEIMLDGTFQDVTSKVMSVSAGVNFEQSFTFYWFDYVVRDAIRPYHERMKDMEDYVNAHPGMTDHQQAKIVPLYPVFINNKEELIAYENDCLEKNFEGVMLRKPNGEYKMGRSTLREKILLKLKRFDDAEATVVDVVELYHNENAKEINELGAAHRSHKKEGLVPAGKLGSLQVVNDAGELFNIGTGFTDIMRQDFWRDKHNIIGKIVKYKYFKIGSKNAPRFPTFVGFREPDDM